MFGTKDLHKIKQRIFFSTEIRNIEQSDVVIEAVLEDLNLKKRIIKQIEDNTNEETLILSNTSGFNITEIAKQSLRTDKIIGVKHTSSDFFQLQQLKALNPDLFVWNGFDEMLLSGLIAGADGGIGSTYNCMPHLFVALYSKFQQGDIQAARELQGKINNIIKIICDVGVYQAEKALMEIQGFECNGCRRPFGKISAENFELMEKVYKKMIKVG